MAASATPKHHHIAEDDEDLTNGDNSGDVSRDLDIDENIKDPVEDRRTLAERSERLHDQLKVFFPLSFNIIILHFIKSRRSFIEYLFCYEASPSINAFHVRF